MTFPVRKLPLAIGSYTDGDRFVPGASGPGLCLAEFDLDDGRLTCKTTRDSIANPSYLAVSGENLYVVSEHFSANGRITRWRWKRWDLERQWSVDSLGRATCHLAVATGINRVFAASYLDGKLAVFRAEDGAFQQCFRYDGRGPDEERQGAAHAHQAVLVKDPDALLVPDLGTDRVWRHRIDPDGRVGEPQPIILPPGTGPRHLVAHPDLPLIYVLGELDGRIHVLRRTPTAIKASGSLSFAPIGWKGTHGGSAVRLHPRLPLLYAAHRGSNHIAMIAIQTDGGLRANGHFSAGGDEPRDFVLSPEADWLLVACQNSNRITAHRLGDDGHPEDRTATAFGTPACLHFLPENCR
jgi:6-phosphogluconolactonase